MSDDETFEATDAGASLTFPTQAGNVKKGDFVMLGGFPCKIVDVATSKTGKHGHAKASITGLDIFNGRKHEEICPSSHSMPAPFVKRTEYSVIDIDQDSQLTLMTDSGEEKTDLNLPPDEDLASQIRKEFEASLDVTVAVIRAMD
eukprot:392776_1